eukprot:snap_masked-scaffold_21-processed-gene-5.58-mRNA-1 protein AED:1.00 eAED:1.00 QI:0/-1/0/0/-1/1/1/0/125
MYILNTRAFLDTLCWDNDFYLRLHLVRDSYLLTKDGLFFHRRYLPKRQILIFWVCCRQELDNEHLEECHYFERNSLTIQKVKEQPFYFNKSVVKFQMNDTISFHTAEVFEILSRFVQQQDINEKV